VHVGGCGGCVVGCLVVGGNGEGESLMIYVYMYYEGVRRSYDFFANSGGKG
jgi:hypothetical protein